MKQIIGFEVDYDEVLDLWGLKLRYTFSELPDIPQVEYRKHEDLGTLFAFILTFTDEE